MTRNDAHTFEELENSLPAEILVRDPASMEAYRRDRANDPHAGVPLVVVRRTTTEQVQRVVLIAAAHGTPIVPRGAGTGLSGGSTAVDRAIVLSVDRMNTITVDPVTRTVVSGPGALNAEVGEAAAAEHGLWYPPDPSSFEICSIGGNVATNAGGLCCVKYGVTTNYVLGTAVVLADGRAVKLGGPRLKDVAGMSLTNLFVGSKHPWRHHRGAAAPHPSPEPTNHPRRDLPDARGHHRNSAGHHAAHAPLDAGVHGSRHHQRRRRCHKDGLGPRRGRDAHRAVRRVNGGSGCEISLIESICNAHGATECYTTDDPEEGEAFVTARRMAIPAIERHGAVLLEDVGVPLPRLGDLVTGIAEIARRNDVTIATMAHAGDGNTHPLIVHDPSDAEQLARAHDAYGEVMSLAIELGGTITGEHGVGRLKRPWLADYLGDDVLELNHLIKNALDPNGILNPGSVLAPAASQGVDGSLAVRDWRGSQAVAARSCHRHCRAVAG